MRVNVVKLSGWRVPRKFISHWLGDLQKELKKQAGHDIKNLELTVAFVSKGRIKQLNQDFRSQPKVTDILSFSGMTAQDLGELALCGEVVDRQAVEHGLKKNEELGYLLIHGVLHLLGYEHEQGGHREKKMFQLQDTLFEVLRNKYFK